jgi:hypothetical protein
MSNHHTSAAGHSEQGEGGRWRGRRGAGVDQAACASTVELATRRSASPVDNDGVLSGTDP